VQETNHHRVLHKITRRSRPAPLCLDRLGLLLLFDLEEERAVDVRKDTSEGDGGADQGIQLFVAADGQLEMARRDALDLEVLGGVLWQERRVSPRTG
jgi:hypothetical protein